MYKRQRSHRLIVKGAEFEKAFPLSRDLEQEEVQEVMDQLQNSSYNKSIVPVSYTHLDVYKRQELYKAETADFATNTTAELQSLTVDGKAAPAEALTAGSVSYTHLNCVQVENSDSDADSNSNNKEDSSK